ncbi:cysteine protease LapG [Pseudomonas nitroreducens]|uniref:cysteine protease LapG n=1 Tax=Pseudomonas nitroreducens TaxID=46680 RepID=UPI00209DD3AF|nr:transglutaminase-like cysteine peptidase [Pseudomonas nitroreducens]MCP1622774.1 putative transglutaminase-like cysteine proteinase [Pseudomonas nitroreducens]
MQPPRGAPRLFASPLRLRAGVLLLALLALTASAAWNFDTILKNAEQKYPDLGTGKGRIQSWGRLIDDSENLDEPAKLKAVNAFFNGALVFTDDRTVWHQEDYWATPVESLYKGAGDCEDYSIAKFVTLRRLGVASDKLRITYVKALQQNQAHMVLTYYASPTAEPLVLDNLIPQIKPASQRKDLLPVYAFNAEGLWLPGPGGGKRTGDSKKLSRWQDLLTKMRAEGLDLDETR